jgi:hypothetical protein
LQNCLLRNYYQLIIGRICSVYGISFTNEIWGFHSDEN